MGYKTKQLLTDPKTYFETAALIVVIVYTVYAGRQSSTMNKTLVEIKKQTQIAQQSAKAATDAAKTAQDTLRITTEADVSIENFVLSNPPIEVNKTVMLKITLRNSGRLTAKNFVAEVKAELRNSFPASLKHGRKAASIDIPGGKTKTILFDAGTFGSLGDLGLPPKRSLYVYGKFSYTDGYRTQTDSFCGLYLPAAAPTIGECPAPPVY